jgi:hypothetical protein
VEQQVQQSQYIPMPVVSQQQQPQVFYMAVQGNDGKQILQLVQMVQMPGQAGTIMMPVAANGGMHQDVGCQGQMMMISNLFSRQTIAAWITATTTAVST